MKYNSRSLQLINFLALFLVFLPGPVLSNDQYKSSFKKAKILDEEKIFEDAEIYWKKTLDANPPPNIILYAKLKLSNTYSRLGQLDKAVEISRRLSETNPDDFDVWFHLANSLTASNQYSLAIDAFKKTTILKPGEGLSRVGLAFAYFGDQKPNFAIEELRKGMKVFKANKNISWYQDCRLAISQIKGFAHFPPSFADLWLKKNLKRVHETYIEAVLDIDKLLNNLAPIIE
jgi:tetratricopeptide (TPR) repeat protein